MDIEKEIEEIAKVMCGGCADNKECMHCLCAAWYNAEDLYNAGYRKQSNGKWITVGEGITERTVCSNCGSQKGSFMKPPFCNQCGAKMDGVI